MLVPAIIISAVSACVYPFLKWNHKNGAISDCGPYQFVDKQEEEKITIQGTVTFKEEEEKPLTPSQKRRRSRLKQL